ncbi:MAG TPA: hypothetical protein VLA83_12780 [Candidatus Binatia bacterium]|nr:hypothetical protein [Candidatus Binatia bacterium]
MKKYIVPIIVIFLVAAGIFIWFEIVAPARAAARDLEAINGIAVGKTTEAELLGRSAFQTIDRRCIEADCFYHTERTNNFLKLLHLGPPTFFGTAVWVRNGMVAQVAVFVSREGLTPISLFQQTSLPAGCASNPCVKPLIPPNKKLASIRIIFTDESEFRNRMPEAVQASCLSRIHGCTTYSELMPLTRNLGLDALGASK